MMFQNHIGWSSSYVKSQISVLLGNVMDTGKSFTVVRLEGRHLHPPQLGLGLVKR